MAIHHPMFDTDKVACVGTMLVGPGSRGGAGFFPFGGSGHVTSPRSAPQQSQHRIGSIRMTLGPTRCARNVPSFTRLKMVLWKVRLQPRLEGWRAEPEDRLARPAFCCCGRARL